MNFIKSPRGARRKRYAAKSNFQLTVSLTKEQLQYIVRLAKESKTSKSAVVKALIDSHMGETC
jgi:predicted transcriptional regulator